MTALPVPGIVGSEEFPGLILAGPERWTRSRWAGAGIRATGLAFDEVVAHVDTVFFARVAALGGGRVPELRLPSVERWAMHPREKPHLFTG